ncbi:hypothetical protein TEA_023580 [Camellia sinensis var. sinensis]|uniref:Uncharacterized protein n=1 Tax=Camellia sinensis var. sinensis TaxID=542762 RepID=A0A4S4E265_CAMSN|nr:hypothetical protein TEA_023580 [Camellia sinensis var. sinensis]
MDFTNRHCAPPRELLGLTANAILYSIYTPLTLATNTNRDGIWLLLQSIVPGPSLLAWKPTKRERYPLFFLLTQSLSPMFLNLHTPVFSNIDKSSLTQLVNLKNLTQLVEKYDGVEGLASALKTNLEHGINGDDKEDISHDTKLLALTHIKGLPRNVSMVSCRRL